MKGAIEDTTVVRRSDEPPTCGCGRPMEWVAINRIGAQPWMRFTDGAHYDWYCYPCAEKDRRRAEFLCAANRGASILQRLAILLGFISFVSLVVGIALWRQAGVWYGVGPIVVSLLGSGWVAWSLLGTANLREARAVLENEGSSRVAELNSAAIVTARWLGRAASVWAVQRALVDGTKRLLSWSVIPALVGCWLAITLLPWLYATKIIEFVYLWSSRVFGLLLLLLLASWLFVLLINRRPKTRDKYEVQQKFSGRCLVVNALLFASVFTGSTQGFWEFAYCAAWGIGGLFALLVTIVLLMEAVSWFDQ